MKLLLKHANRWLLPAVTLFCIHTGVIAYADAPQSLLTIHIEGGEVDRVNVPVTVPLTVEQVHQLPDVAGYMLFPKDPGWTPPIASVLQRFDDGTAKLHFTVEHLLAGEQRGFRLIARNDKPHAIMGASLADEEFVLSHDDRELLRYQVTPMTNPTGGERFAGSAFIHPLNTPAGFNLTNANAGSHHLHHFGLWWPWKYVAVDGRRFNSWELQQGQGMVRGREIVSHTAGPAYTAFVARSDIIDRHNYDEEKVILHETVRVRQWQPMEQPAHGYLLDITIEHTPAVDKPVEIVRYRYSGFCIRGTRHWTNDNSTVLTSEGKDRDNSNATRARWVRVAGTTPDDGKAGLVMMTHPDNPDFPELLRTWNSRQHNGSIFINFNPVQQQSLTIAPDQTMTRQYRLFIYDGELTAAQADQLWQNYAKPVKTRVE